MGGQIVSIFCRLTGKVFSNSFLMNPVSNAVLIPTSPRFVKASPVFSKGKSECRVRVFVESGFSTGPSPGFLRVRSGFRRMSIFRCNIPNFVAKFKSSCQNSQAGF